MAIKLHRAVIMGFILKMALRLRKGEGVHHVNCSGKNIPGRGNNHCKGPSLSGNLALC